MLADGIDSSRSSSLKLLDKHKQQSFPTRLVCQITEIVELEVVLLPGNLLADPFSLQVM